MSRSGFRRFAWFNVAYNLGVIVWGAFVRATGSGAGCGEHWPLCNGVVVPRPESVETLIELTHRVTSGIALILVVLLVVWARKLYAKGEATRQGAHLSLVLMIVEALLGAGLVLFGLVEDDASVARAFMMMIHLVNTLILLAALSLTAWWASGGPPLQLRGHGALGTMFLLGLIAMLVLGATGAIAALGDTLFPAGSLREGIAQDFDPAAHFLLRLRIFHPLLAIATGVYLVLLAWVAMAKRQERRVRVWGGATIGLFLLQLTIGVINLLLLAPVWLQLVHLFAADLVWISLIFLMASSLAVEEEREDVKAPATEPSLAAL